jgi:hypothetical protein
MQTKLKDIKPPVKIEWERTLCRNRGTYKIERAIIISKKGRNLETENGEYLWWPDINGCNVRIVA